ncbi:uncharacterized protein PRD47_008271 [Ara ararauna]
MGVEERQAVANKERAGAGRVQLVLQVSLPLWSTAAAMAPLSLSELLDAAISPSGGHVNFMELHGLLRAVLGLLGLRDLPVPDWEQPAQGVRARAQHVGQRPPEPGERQPRTAPLQGTASGSRVDVEAAGVGQPNELQAWDSSSSEVEELRAMVRNAEQEQAERQVVCPMYRDPSAPEGNLLQRFEKLQEQVDSLLSRQEEGKVERPRSQVRRRWHVGLGRGLPGPPPAPSWLCCNGMWGSPLLPPQIGL